MEQRDTGNARSTSSPLPADSARLKVPAGGNASGYGEALSDLAPDGSLGWAMPVPVTPARDAEPQLSLSYSSSAGNGVFGVGFDIATSAFALITDNGVPRYDGRDRVQGPGGDELVPAYVSNNGSWLPIEERRVVDGVNYLVTRFRPCRETEFDLIERWLDPVTCETFWQVTDSTARVSVFGRTQQARIADPAHPERVYRWLLERVVDAHGNESRYHYKLEDGLNVPPALYERAHAPNCQRYLSRIEYGNWIDPTTGATRFGLHVVFDYGEYDLDSGSAAPARAWAARPDPFSNFRSGFEIRTQRRCLGVLMVHQFPALRANAPTLVHALRFEYTVNQGQSQLLSVQRQGFRHDDDDDAGAVDQARLPPITFGYCGFDAGASACGQLGVMPADGPPVLQNGGDFRFADLYGDGIPGVLGADRDRLVYWPPAGAAALGHATVMPELPTQHVPNAETVLMDLSGSARLDMTVLGEQMGGTYINNQDGTWRPFLAFDSYTNRFADPSVELIDLRGNGMADAVVFADAALDAALASGDAGYKQTVVESLPVDFPHSDDPGSALVTFADMFGDGLAHRVRVSNGSVEIWPALGWGRYGDKITMAGAPQLATGVPTGRLLFGNFVGSGVADLLVIGETFADLYPNVNGNFFLAPIRIPLPIGIDERTRFDLADLFGAGRPCLTLSRTGSSFMSRYLRFGAQQPPRALNSVDNGRGMIHRITYRSAIDYRFADRATDPWVTRLPLTVQVVDTVIAENAVDRSTQTRTYQYRNGYWNSTQKKFGGFGEVIVQDSVGFDPALWHFRAIALPSEELEPQCQRIWQQTGAYREADALNADMKRRMFNGDTQAIALPLARFAADILAADAETQAQAYYALRGRRSRVEVYGVMSGVTATVPYSVEQTSLHVRMLQPRIDGRPAVFHVSERESATSFYEKDAFDPRIEHAAVTLEDEYGHAEQVVTVHYPRRTALNRPVSIPGQDTLRITCSVTKVRNVVAPFYRLGVDYENWLFEIANETPAGDRYFSFHELAAKTTTALANVIAFGEPFGVSPAARPFAATRTYFWNAEQTQCLPLGELTREALVCHATTAVFPERYPDIAYEGRVTAAMLQQDARYELVDGYWWSRAGRTAYLDATGFYLPVSLQDPFQIGTSLSTVTRYDDYRLAPVQVIDPLGQAVQATLDYQLLSASSVTDVNGTRSEVLFDALGRVIVSATHGAIDGQYAGNMTLSHYRRLPRPPSIDAILAAPGDYLQGAGAYFYYADFADASEPQHQLTLVAADFVNSPTAAKPSGAVRLSTAWQDGAGKDVCSKVAVEAEFALPEDRPAGAGPLIWIVDSRQALDPRGNPAKRYLPYFSATAQFEPLPAAPCFRYRYDALDRVVHIDQPDGTCTKTVYSSWAQTYYDENDTTPGRFDFDTPTTLHHDNRGYTVMQSQINVLPDDPTRSTLNELSVLDIAGQTLKQCDARFYDAADPLAPTRWNFIYHYDMQGNVLSEQSVDAGNATAGVVYTLHTSAGDTARSWNARGFMTAIEYALPIRRELRTTVTQNGAQTTTVAYTYGADAAKNNVNLPIVTLDTAGRLDSPEYDLSGAPLSVTRRFSTTYTNAIDWREVDRVPLSDEEWIVRIQRNAVGEVIEETMADGTCARPRRYLNGTIRAVDTQWAGDSSWTTSATLQYNASLGRRAVKYANGVASLMTYASDTYRLQRAVSTRASGGDKLQDLGYDYDPVGNVVKVTNGTEPMRYARGQAVAAVQAFGYDALYQLRQATGRCSATLPACGPGSASAAPNDAGQIEAYTRTYDYDRGGNLGQIHHQAGSGRWNMKLAISATSNHAVPASMAPEGRSPDEFFDACGNLLALPTLAALDYDDRNLLVKATVIARPGGIDDADFFIYDASGVRVRKVSQRMAQGGGTVLVTDTLYVGGVVVSTVTSTAAGGAPQVLAQVQEASMTAETFRLVLSERQVKPAIGARSWRYTLGNLQDSVVVETDQNAAITAYREYFPYGCLAIDNGGWVTEAPLPQYRFIGRECDAATGFYCFDHRYYIPWLGRWLTPDPSGPQDRLNLYEYADNNPLTLVDTQGLDPEDAARLYHALRYMTSSELNTAIDIANAVFDEAYKNKKLFTDESARFSKALETRMVSFFGEFIFAFAAGNSTLADSFENAGSTSAEASTDRRNAYKTLRTSVNKSIAIAFPELDFTPGAGERPFEMHHMLYKANHPTLATTTFNFAMTTRGSSSSARIGTHEGLFHLITSGNDTSIYTREIAGVIGVIKRMVAGTQGINLNTTPKPPGANAWLSLKKGKPYSLPGTAPTTGARAKSVRAQYLAARKREQRLGLKTGERFVRLRTMTAAQKKKFNAAAAEQRQKKDRAAVIRKMRKHFN